MHIINVMFNRPDTIEKHLLQYGLSKEQIDIYLYLLQQGFQSALTISRKLRLGRTKIYRILDELSDKGLINRRLGSRGLEFGTLSYRQLEYLLIDKEKELSQMKESVPILYRQLEKLVPFSDQPSQILYYSGKEGLEQVTWNSTKAKDMVRIYELKDMDAFLEHGTAELMREKFVENKIKTHQLTNAKHIDNYTNVTEKVNKYWEVRHVSPEKLTIEFEVLIYNDVYAIYSYKESEVFCIEIYSEQLARMQKQLFDFIWSYSQKMNILNEKGKAAIDS